MQIILDARLCKAFVGGVSRLGFKYVSTLTLKILAFIKLW